MTEHGLHPPAIAPDALRIFVYDVLVDWGFPPTAAEIGAQFSVTAGEARDALRRLEIGKTLLTHPNGGDIWMAGPFSAEPTPYRVTAGSRSWWANCAWDMLGIPVIIGESVEVDAACYECGEPMRMRVDGTAGPEPAAQGIVHFLVPARRWYDDIGFT
jgi:hypothetical protein